MAEYEAWLGAALPRCLREMLAESNGATVYGTPILAVPDEFKEQGTGEWFQDQQYLRGERLLRIYSWGYERDYDCIALEGSAYPEGAMVHVNGDPERAVCYQPSMEVWLEALIANAHRDGGILHPMELALRGLRFDECAAGEIVRTAVERGWDIFSVEGVTAYDPVELRRLAEDAVAAQPRRQPYDPCNLVPTIIVRPDVAKLSRKARPKSALAKLVKSWEGVEIVLEERETSTLTLRSGVEAGRLAQLEQSMGRPLPADYIDFMSVTDGLKLGLFEIFSIDMQGYRAEHGFLTVADWGNGDSDCLVVSGDRFPVGSVVFCNHNPDDAAVISDSFGAWVRGLMEETRRCGGVAHPRDYINYPDREPGVYAHIPEAMRDLDCELNR